MKRIGRYFPFAFLLLFCLQFAEAQSRFDLYIGFGAIQDSATGMGIEGDETGTYSVNPQGECTTGNPADPTCVASASLSGFYMGFGGSLMLWKHLGLGANVSFQPGKETYATFPEVTYLGEELQPAYQDQTRVTFYSFDGIYEPVSSKKYALDILGGIGGANIKFYQNETITGSLVGSANQSQYFGSSNHFQLHAGVGFTIFVNDHVFLRPEFDFHFVPNLVQFGRNIVTSEQINLGYSFGDR